MSETEIKILQTDMKWVKRLLLIMFGAMVGLHFTDPVVHYWVFQFP